ncbi:MAG: chromate efflux transporter [bacterium]
MKTPKELAKVLLKVGFFGFGGGIGMLAILRAECVKKRKLVTDDDLCTAVAMGQMLPGPFISNYCEYIGYHLFGLKGAVLAAAAILLPSFVLMLILSWFYLTYQSLPGVTLIFKGIGAVMTSIILWAAYDMGRVLIKDIKGIIVFVFALILFLVKFDPILTVIICGFLRVGLDHVKTAKQCLLAIPLFVFHGKKAITLAAIFLKIGAIIFGGGYAAIPFIKNEVCNTRAWLTPQEFLDGIALGQMTPGPVAITATFVGFKVMGLPGAIIATLSIFLPSFIMLMILVKIYKKVDNNKYVMSFFNGIKSAVVAILLSTGILFASLNWLNIPYGIFGIVVLIVLLLIKIEPIFLILGGAIFSLIIG